MDHTGRFCQHADAHELPVPALMFGDERLEYLLAMRFQAFKRSRIVLTHEARVVDASAAMMLASLRSKPDLARPGD